MTLQELRELAQKLPPGAAITLPREAILQLVDIRPVEPVPVSPPTPTKTEAELLTPTEAAKRLGVSVRWLYRHHRKLPFARKLAPRVLRFDAAALDRWVERQRLAAP